MASVLIVDDEADLANLVEFNFKQAGFDTVIAGTGLAALREMGKTLYDLVLLDVMLPDMSGKEVCRQLRANERTREVPIVMLTARGEELDRVEGFQVGADDYVTKPFSPRELLLRAQAILRRSGVRVEETKRLQVGPLSLEQSSHRAFVHNVEVSLTAIEFKLLNRLMARPGKVSTREELLHDVWGITSRQETRTVDTHVMRLRDKLLDARSMVETVRGVGYRLSDAR